MSGDDPGGPTRLFPIAPLLGATVSRYKGHEDVRGDVLRMRPGRTGQGGHVRSCRRPLAVGALVVWASVAGQGR
jgi:hypothetical protein